MALFTGKDFERMTVATQAYQVEPEEAERFVKKVVVAWRLYARSPEGSYPTDAECEAGITEGPIDVSAFMETQKFVRLILDELADYRSVKADILEDFCEWRKAIGPTQILSGPIDENGRIDPSKTMWDSKFRNASSLAHEASWRIVEEIWNLCQRHATVRRCESCGSPYVVLRNREENRWCSARCSARERMRARARRRHGDFRSKNVDLQIEAECVR